jgi:uncharacterized protein (TIGR03435 family)
MNNLMDVEIAVLDSLWQAALLVGLAWLILRFARRINAATRFVIWWAVLGVTLILPGAPHLIGMGREWLQPATIQVARPLYASVAPGTLTDIRPLVTVAHRSATHWPVYLAAVWGLILLFRLAHLVRSFLHVRGIKNRAFVSSQPLPAIRRSASLLLSSEIDSPIAVGFVRPAVILPASLPAQLSREEIDHVLLHETAHLVRWDDWTNLISRALGAALTLHPIAQWIMRHIELEREKACDEWVVARTKSAQPYARSLARLYELRFSDHRDALLGSGMFSNKSQFGERIEALLRRGREFTARVSVARVAAGCAVLITLTAVASYLPHWIAFAQVPRPSFDVASIKRNTTGDNSADFSALPGGRLHVRNNAIANVIHNAYGIAGYQVIGAPDWVQSQSESYDIEAKGKDTAGEKDVMLMLQTLLADRFMMRAHFEPREMSAYILTIAKGGSKLSILNPEDCVPFDSTKPDPRSVPNVCGNSLTGGARGDVRWRATHISMPGVTQLLSAVLRGPVIDRTGIKGTFDINLRWSGVDLAPSDNPDAPPVFASAVRETLGLEWKSGRGAVDVLVVEHIERPSSN